MNRFVLGASLLLLSPVVAGCSNFYVLAPPAPEPTPTTVPPLPDYPVDATQGLNTTLPSPSQGIALNGPAPLPQSFRAADVLYIALDKNDPANCTPLLILQSSSTDTTGNTSVGPADVSNPVRLAGIIVPGPRGQAAAGLKDPDLIALQAQAYTRSLDAMRSWAQGPLTSPTQTPTSVSTTRPNVARPTVTPIPRALASRPLDVYQDPRYLIDSDNRRMVQVMFTSVEGIKIKPTPVPGQTSSRAAEPLAQVIVEPNTKLSLARMMLRSGWAVVDLYSSTSFDQATWLLDEAYARHRKLGMWGMQLNGKRLSLQQRAPVISTGTGRQSNIPLTTNEPMRGGTPRPGATPGTRGPVTSATQSPAKVIPTLPPIPAPSIVPNSGSNVQLGPTRKDKLPPPSQSAVPAAPVTGTGTSSGNVAVP